MTSEQNAALEAAKAQYRDALEAIANAGDDADLDALEASADEAKGEFERLQANYEKRAAAVKAMDALPESPAPIPAPVVRTEAKRESRSEIRVSNEPLTYGRREGAAEHSFLRDLIMANPPQGMARDDAAQERLIRHQREMQIEKRDSTTTDTTSIGEMIPPMWAVDKFAALARAGRPLANYLGSMPLPRGTDTIIVPKVTTGGSVHFQVSQNGTVAEQDMVTGGTAQAPIKTVAGQIDTSLQSIEWGAINMIDSFFLPELYSLHANRIETTVGTGTGANGQFQGLLGTSGTQNIAYALATPVAGSLYAKIADGVQQVHTNRFLPPDLIVMHPRRWGWLLAQSDTTGRPLVVPNPQGPFNAVGQFGGVASEGIVGTLQGLPVLVSSAAVSITDSTGSTNDVVYITRKDDLWLWESDVRTRVLYEVLSGNLTVRIQLYNYATFMADRYPTATSAVRGTGLATPTF